MKKYMIYMRRLCALLLALTLLISQDIIPVNALPDGAQAETATVSDDNAAAKAADPVEESENKEVEAADPVEETENKEVEAADPAKESENKEVEVTDPTEESGNKEVEAAEEEPVEKSEESAEEVPTSKEVTSKVKKLAGAPGVKGTFTEVHVNPSKQASNNVLGDQATISAGNNTSGDGTFDAPVYTLGKAAELAQDGAVLKVYNEITLNSAGTNETGESISGGQEGVASADYFTENRGLTICVAASSLNALFNVESGCNLTLRNTKLKLIEDLTQGEYASTERLRISQGGGHTTLGENLTLPSNQFYFYLAGKNDEDSGKQVISSDDTAPIIVNTMPESGIPVLVNEKFFTQVESVVATEKLVTTETWDISIPIVKLPEGATDEDAQKVTLVGIGQEGQLSAGVFEGVARDEDDSALTNASRTVHVLNEAPKLVLEDDGIVYLKAKRVVTTTAKHEYNGMIFVGEPIDESNSQSKANYGKISFEGQKADDNNDGLTEDTPVRTLNKAKELLDIYDAQYREKYPYPKIILNHVCMDANDGEQSLNFANYKDDRLRTGYRASVVLGRSLQYYIYLTNGGSLTLGKGVILKDYYVYDSSSETHYDENLGKKSPDEIQGKVNHSSTRYMLFSPRNGKITLDHAKMEFESGKVHPCDMYGSEINVKDSTIITNLTGIYISGGTCRVTGATIIKASSNCISGSGTIEIDLTGTATYNPIAETISGDSYFWSDNRGIELSGGTASIKNGVIVGYGGLMASGTDAKLYIENGEIYTRKSDLPVIHIRGGEVFFQGGQIHTKEGQTTVKVEKYDSSSYDKAKFILNGGQAVLGENFLIQCTNKAYLPLELGDGKGAAYGSAPDKCFQVDLLNSWTDLTNVVGCVNGADQSALAGIAHIFDLQNDGATEEYEGKELTYYKGYLVLAGKGIYVDGTDYNTDSQLGGRNISEGGSGTLGAPVKTLLEAQKIYNRRSSEELQGVYILNQVTINGEKVTLSKETATDIVDSDTPDSKTEYTCNFGDLIIYDSSQLQPTDRKKNDYNDAMFYLTGTGELTIESGVILDASLIEAVGKTNAGINHIIRADGNSKVAIRGTLQNLNYTNDSRAAALHFTGNSELSIDGGRFTSERDAQGNLKTKCWLINCETGTKLRIQNAFLDSYRGVSVSGLNDEFVFHNSEISTYDSNASLWILSTKSQISGNSKIISPNYWGIKIDGSQEVTISDTTTVSGEYGVYAYYCECLSIKDDVKINGQGVNGYGVFSEKSNLYIQNNVKISGQQYYAVIAQKGSNVYISGNPFIVNYSDYPALYVHCTDQRGIVEITGGTILSQKNSGIMLENYYGLENGYTLKLVANDDTPVTVQGKMVGVISNDAFTIQLGGNVKIDGNISVDAEGNVIPGEGGTDLMLKQYNSKPTQMNPVKVVKALTGTDEYRIYAERVLAGKVLADGSEGSIQVSDYQKRFVFTEAMQKLLASAGIVDGEGHPYQYPNVTTDQLQLVIPYSRYLYLDPVNGKDQNSEKENGGRTPELAVKSVNGLRALLDNSSELMYQLNGGQLKILMMKSLSAYAYSSNNPNRVTNDPDIYGDIKNLAGDYVPCSAGNPADILNWKFEKEYTYQDGQKHPMPEVLLWGLGVRDTWAINATAADGTNLNIQIENVTFSAQEVVDPEGKKVVVSGVAYVRGKDAWLSMRNTTIEGYYSNPSSSYYANNQIIYAENKNTEIIHCVFQKIEGVKGYFQNSGGALVAQNGGNLLIEDMSVKESVLDGNYVSAVFMRGGSSGVIRGNTTIDLAGSARGIRLYDADELTFEQGRIQAKGTYSVIEVEGSNTHYYQKENVQILQKNSEVHAGTGLYAYKAGTVSIEGGLISGFNIGAFANQVDNFCISGGMMKNNNLGVGMNQNTVLRMSGGKIRENQGPGISCSDSSNYGFKVIMSGGEIAENEGSGISRIRDITLSGGTIRNNQGAGITGYSAVSMSGGVITQNGGTDTDTYAGGISCSTLEMTGGTISNNENGGIYVGSLLEIFDGKIVGNHKSTTGGGILGSGTMKIYGGTIENNRAVSGGGIYHSGSGTLEIYGGTIRENIAEGTTETYFYGRRGVGGGIYCDGTNFKLNGGRILDNTANLYGGGLYLIAKTPELNAGEISGNQVQDAEGKGSGVFYMTTAMDAPDECLKLGRYGVTRPVIPDVIYLANRDGEIQTTAAVRDYYTVEVNEEKSFFSWKCSYNYTRYDNCNTYNTGNTVVIPDNSNVRSAASYLTHFTLISKDKVLDKKVNNLVLAGLVFVDGVNGNDTSNTGSNPNAAFKTIRHVLDTPAFDNHVIYICGAAYVESGETLTVNDRTIRRYTGQPLNSTPYDAYKGPLLVVKQGGTLNLNNTIVSGRMGCASDEGFEETGYLIENYGTLNLDVEATTGAYTGVSPSAEEHTLLADNLTEGLAVEQCGTMKMSTFSQMDQIIRLGARSATESEDHILEIVNDSDTGAGLSYPLDLVVENPYNGRVVSTYTGLHKNTDLQKEKGEYTIRELNASGLYLAHEDHSTDTEALMRQIKMVLRQPGIYYVDGTPGGHGDDTAHSGKSPVQAFETLERAYKALAEDAKDENLLTRGGLIYIVGTAEIPDETSITYSNETGSTLSIGSERYSTMGDVVIRRYSKPNNPSDTTGYAVDSFEGTMLKMSASADNITLEGVTLDGHSQPLENSDSNLKAPAVKANGPILEIPSDANLTLGAKNAVNDTLLQNNVSSGNGGLISCAGTLNIFGNAQDSYYDEESDAHISQPATILQKAEAKNGGAIYIEDGGLVYMSGSVLRDCTAEKKGSAVYAKPLASLTFGSYKENQKLYPNVDGVIYLGGNKTTIEDEGDCASSNLIVFGDTQITDGQYKLEVQDAYDQRTVVLYNANSPLSLTAEDIRDYIVYGKGDYNVTIGSTPFDNKLILTKPKAVYIDGVYGSDDADGKTPSTAVATLKTAYEKLQDLEGGVLYVVNTVTIDRAESLSENSYKEIGMTEVTVDGTVSIKRYVRPSAYGDDSKWSSPEEHENYNKDSNKNALFKVTTGGILTLGNIVLDGHKDPVNRTDTADAYKTNADGVNANAPLICVYGGELKLNQGAVLQNNVNAITPSEVNVSDGKLPGGAIYNAGTVEVTGGTVKDNIWKGTPKDYTVSVEDSSSEKVTVTPNASGIWQAGTMTVNVSDESALHWGDNQYIYLAEQEYDSSVTEVAAKDAKVSFLNVQALPTGTVLPLDLSRDGAKDSNSDGTVDAASGWFAPGRKVVEMVTGGAVTAENFKVNADSFVGTWLEASAPLTEKLVLAQRETDAKVLELQRPATDCIIDVIVPVKAEAGSSPSITNLSKKVVNASGAVPAGTEIGSRTDKGGTSEKINLNSSLSETNRVKISCSDGQ